MTTKWIGLWAHKVKHIDTGNNGSLCGLLPGHDKTMIVEEKDFTENRVPCSHCLTTQHRRLMSKSRKIKRQSKNVLANLAKCTAEPR